MRLVGILHARRLGRIALVTALVGSVLGVAAIPATAAAPRTGQEHFDEWDFVARANAARSAAGLSTLGVVSTLRETARDHSERMADAGDLFHPPEGELGADAGRVSSCWSRVGENVGAGASVESVHDALMRSTGHRENILGDFQYIGIGVESRDGRLWVTQRFLKLRAGCTLPQVSRPTFHWLDVTLTGSGYGRVTSPAAIDCGTDCREPNTTGARMTLTATPATGSVFRGWSGGGCSGTSTCTVTMDAARSVTALFVARHLLTVTTTGSGTGAVVSFPAGIDCGPDCSETLDEGAQVTLSATAAPGSAFRGWTGAGCSGEGDCTLTLAHATSVVAEFVALHELDVTVDGSGGGTVTSFPDGIDCGAECSALFDEGTEVTLVAIPDEGSAFRGWSGDVCSGVDDCTVSMDEARFVTATFVAQHDLEIFKSGTGNGTVRSLPAGIRCGFDCAETVDEATEVVLTATANRWSRFVRWGGACAGAGRTCVVVVDRATTATVTFNRRRR